MKNILFVVLTVITLTMFLPSLSLCADSSDKSAFDIINRVNSKDGDLGWDVLVLGMEKFQLEEQLKTKLKLHQSDDMSCGAYEATIYLKGHGVILEFPDNKPDSKLLSIIVYWHWDKDKNSPKYTMINIETLRELDKILRKNSPGLKRKEGRDGPSPTLEEGGDTSLYGISKSDSLVILIKDSNIYLSKYSCIDAN